jgi:hypothetical protein
VRYCCRSWNVVCWASLMPTSVHKRITDIFTKRNLILSLDLCDGLSVRCIIRTLEEQGSILLLKWSCVHGFIFCLEELTARWKEIETNIVVTEFNQIQINKWLINYEKIRKNTAFRIFSYPEIPGCFYDSESNGYSYRSILLVFNILSKNELE